MTTPNPEMEQALSKAKIHLMTKPDSTFFTHILLSLKFKWDTGCRTAYTNGTVIGFNPTFFMGMTPEERVGVLVHEAMHVAYMHMDRLQERDRSLFNIAADHVINLQLLERNFKLPAMRLADSRFVGMGTEEVYAILKADEAAGAPQMPNGMEDLQASDLPGEELRRELQDIIVRAAVQSKMAGDRPGCIPGEIQIFLDKLLNPKLPWYTILRKYCNARAKNDYSMRKPNRRFFPKYHLPSMYSEKMSNITIAVDTSGSVSDEEFNRFVSETYSIMKMLKPKKITLIQFDTEIKNISVIRNAADLMKVAFTGRGGTRIQPVINWVNENKPALLLVFTDGEFDFYSAETKIDTVWLIHDNASFKANFGKTIHYTAKE